MSKKSKRSALWYFATECQKKRKLQGSIHDIIAKVIPEWKALSPKERLPYEELYEKWKRNPDSESSYKPSPSIQNTPCKSENTLSEEYVKLSIQSLTKPEIAAKKWYIIKFLTFCKTSSNPYKQLGYDYDPYYVIAEVGLIEYSLLNGITKQYHAFIKPNDIPIGWKNICQDSIKDHKIPLQDSGLVKKSYSQINKDIEDFIANNNDTGFFCMEKDLEETKFCLRFLRDQIKPISSDNEYSVSVLEFLVNVLFLKAGVESSKFSAKQILSSYSYDYSSQTRCEYHDEQSVIACAIGIAKRYAYLISDNICQYFDIDVTEKHLPVEESASEIVSCSTSSYDSSLNKRKSKPSSKISNDNATRAEASNYVIKNEHPESRKKQKIL